MWKLSNDSLIIMLLKIFIFLIFISVLMSGDFVSYGAQFDYPWTGITEVGGQSGLVAKFYQIALALVGVTAFAVVVFAGVLYIVNASNPSKQKEVMDWIWAAIFGIVLLLGAYLLFYTINPELVKLTLPRVDKIDLPPPSPPAPSPTASPVSGLNTGPINQAASNMISIKPPLVAEIAACESDAATPKFLTDTYDFCIGNKKDKYIWIQQTCKNMATISNAQDFCASNKMDIVGGTFAKNYGACCKPR